MHQLLQQEEFNFLLTNRIPRRLVTQFMGWFSQIEQPLVRDASLATWKLFADLELDDAARSDFRSMHDCFIRQLKPGARAIDPHPRALVSPCDGIVGGFGRCEGTRAYQAKGFPYTLEDLLIDPALVEQYRNGWYITLRLTSSMYHRFHAPHDSRIEHVTYVSGDTWNTNPIALERVERLYCKNERAVIRARLTQSGQPYLLVAVAAILVASIRIHCLDVVLDLKHRGPNEFPVDARCKKGEELGYFQHGSTIVMFAQKDFELSENVRPGATVRMGQALLLAPT
jgi:phosphatidylserine decarboxylase